MIKGHDALGRFTSEYTHPNKGQLATKFCERCKVLFTPYPGTAKRTRFCGKACAKIGNTGRLGQRSTSEHVAKIVAKKIGRPIPSLRGAGNHRWKGGITPENHRIRTSLEYKVWRRSVYERDDYTCVECKQRGGRLNADHVKPFARYPELRLEISNGRTLCVPCHRKTDTWGGRVGL